MKKIGQFPVRGFLKKKRFSLKRFIKLSKELEETLPVSEVDGWRDMGIEQKIEWLKNRVDDLIYEKK